MVCKVPSQPGVHQSRNPEGTWEQKRHHAGEWTQCGHWLHQKQNTFLTPPSKARSWRYELRHRGRRSVFEELRRWSGWKQELSWNSFESLAFTCWFFECCGISLIRSPGFPRCFWKALFSSIARIWVCSVIGCLWPNLAVPSHREVLKTWMLLVVNI